MKLSRRCFLSFIVGGAAGTALSPLPWKLTDDLSIWSQNWPWTPVPPDGAASVVNTTCTLCPGGCGIGVRKVDTRAVKIEGIAGHPVNDGGICMLGLSGLQLLYGPTRIQAPLKRVGARGQGSWQTVTWEAAVSEVASQLNAIRGQGNPQALACIAARRNGTVSQLLQRLMMSVGSHHFFHNASVEDAYGEALKLTQGTPGNIGFDIENSDFILSFGCALMDGYASPVRMIRALSLLKDNKGTLVQVEPRLSNTAAKADLWLPARPGSEADLALAMASVIIDRQRVNAEFINAHVEGFDAFARMVKEKYTPAAVAAKTGLSAEVIADAALRFADAKNPVAIYGRGKGNIPGSLKEVLAVQALNALVGSVNRKGGTVAVDEYNYIDWPAATVDDVAAAGLKAEAFAGHGIHQFISAIKTAPAKCKALIVADANPYHTLADSTEVKAALDQIPFVVSFSSFMDETAMNADLILPSHIYLERYEDVPCTAAIVPPIVGLCQPVVKPLYHTQHPGDTIIQIAQAMGGGVAESFAWEDYQSCLTETLGDQWESMVEKGVRIMDDYLQPQWGDGFQTASGKYVLMNDAVSAVYTAKEVAIEGDEATYPLILVPYDSIRLAAGEIGEPPFMMKTLPDDVLKGNDCFVEINPQTASQAGLKGGQAAVLSTPRGQARVRVSANEGIMPGIVAMPRGLGHTAWGPFLAGKGANINGLIGPQTDPASGLNAAWGIRARMAKA